MDGRPVEIVFRGDQKRIDILGDGGGLLRTLDFQNLADISVRSAANKSRIIIKAKNHYDLYMQWSDSNLGHQMLNAIEKFVSDAGLTMRHHTESWFEYLFCKNSNWTTREDRKKELDTFSRLVLEQVSKVAQDITIWIFTITISYIYCSNSVVANFFRHLKATKEKKPWTRS